MDAFRFTVRHTDFNKELLGIDKGLLASQPEMLEKAIERYFLDRFGRKGGQVSVVSRDGATEVMWLPRSFDSERAVFDYCLKLLREGNYEDAEPFLMALAASSPDDASVAKNYGMMLSDRGRLDEAVTQLERAVKCEPDLADAWNALGVAYQRKGEGGKARNALETSHRLAPDNPYTLRNLGGLVAEADASAAAELLRRAVELLPNDQQSLYGYGLVLFKLERLDEADGVLKKAIAVSPYTEISEQAKIIRTSIAHKNMRSSGGGLRMDAVMYCLAAIQHFEKNGAESRKKIALEVALLGRNGLDINNSAQKYTMKSMPGKFSGLQLLCYMYVGLKQIDPKLDVGVDFSKEYEMAKSLGGTRGKAD